jgi:hypothetical protein
MHFQYVTQDCPPLLLRYFIAMSSIEPARREETEHDKSARLIFFEGVADRSMSASRSNSQCAVEAHWRPFVVWPKTIVAARQGINQ